MPKVVSLVLCGLGVLIMYAALRLSRLGRETRHFTRTLGRVLAADVEELPAASEEGWPRFRAKVRYAFEARGQTYESSQVSVGAPRGAESSDAREARRWAERYPAGSPVDVWFDPADPGRSVLVRDVPRAQVLVGASIGIALVGVGMFALAR